VRTTTNEKRVFYARDDDDMPSLMEGITDALFDLGWPVRVTIEVVDLKDMPPNEEDDDAPA
jgi:hypothetical protein